MKQYDSTAGIAPRFKLIVGVKTRADRSESPFRDIFRKIVPNWEDETKSRKNSIIDSIDKHDNNRLPTGFGSVNKLRYIRFANREWEVNCRIFSAF